MKLLQRDLPILLTSRLTLRLGEREDAPEIVDYFVRNEAHFRPTDPERPAGFDTVPFWLEQLERSRLEFHRDQSARLFLFERGGSKGPTSAREGGVGARVVGTANLTQFVRGPFHACYLGYGLDQAEQGKGLMSEALEATIDYAFGELGLHRVMANYMPHNDRSARVLSRLGFEIEGTARAYLRIGGEWRDHVLTSLINPAWRVPPRPAGG